MSRKTSRNRRSKRPDSAAAASRPRKKMGKRSVALITLVLSAMGLCGVAQWKAQAITSLPSVIGHKAGYLASPTPTAPKLTKEYIYSNGGMVATVEPVTGGTGSITAPTNLIATTMTTSRVDIRWTAPSTGSVEEYVLERGTSVGGSFTRINASSPTSNTFSDTDVAPDHVYLYRVRAKDTNNNLSIYSNLDLATVWNYLDDPLVAGMPVKATDITQTRDAANAARAAVGLSAKTWTDTVVIGFAINEQHMTELLNTINEARAHISIPEFSFTDPGPAIGGPIRASHINDLRAALH